MGLAKKGLAVLVYGLLFRIIYHYHYLKFQVTKVVASG